eukprot:COSAG02_NODE_10208_length_1995_cov_1.472046_3_plen_261_part_00
MEVAVLSSVEPEPEPEPSQQVLLLGACTTTSSGGAGEGSAAGAVGRVGTDAAAAAADSPMSVLREELNKVTISHEHVAELLPALGGFLSANNPLLAAVDAVQSIAHAPAQPKSGLIHWLGEMASEAPPEDTSSIEPELTESSGDGSTAGWLSGLGWGGGQEAEASGEAELLEELQEAEQLLPRRPVPPQHHDPDDDIGGLEHPQHSPAQQPRDPEQSTGAVEAQSVSSSSSCDTSRKSEKAAAGGSAAGDVGERSHLAGQ